MSYLSLKKLIVIHLLAIIFLYMFLLVFAGHIAQDNPTITWNQNQPSSFRYSEPEARIPSVPPERVDFQQIQQYNRESELTEEQLTYIDKFGEPNINKIKDWKKLDKSTRDKALSKLTGRQISTDEPVNGKVVGNDIQFNSIKFLKIDQTSITNGIGVIYDGIKLRFKHADSLLTDKSASTNIDNFEGFADIFSVEKADSFLSDCVRVDDIKDSEFKVSNIIEITTKSNVNLKITDCSYSEVEFNGKGKVIVDKSSDNPKYIIENGTLTKKENSYNETAESNNSVIIETDKTFGFKCLTISPVGSYFYNDKDLRKDFIINVPKESSTYKLCLRKNTAQQFKDYNGLVDFVDKKIELNGIVNYLRYPLKNNQISSLLSDFVYKGLKDVKTLLTYDENLIFLNNVEIKNILKNKQQITITKPNNFYSIEEIELGDGKIHRVVDISLISKEDATQNILSNYESDSLDADVNINDNILVQQIGESKVTILPPEHPKINSFLR